MKPTALVTTKTRFRKSASGRIGSSARDSTNGKSASSARPATIIATISGELHLEVVHLARAEDGADDDERERADRQVDVEDPAPGEVVDEEAAEQRPDHRRHAEHGAEEALVATSLARRDDVADDGDARHHQPAAA